MVLVVASKLSRVLLAVAQKVAGLLLQPAGRSTDASDLLAWRPPDAAAKGVVDMTAKEFGRRLGSLINVALEHPDPARRVTKEQMADILRDVARQLTEQAANEQ